jgi:hypothetical protein
MKPLPLIPLFSWFLPKISLSFAFESVNEQQFHGYFLEEEEDLEY